MENKLSTNNDLDLYNSIHSDKFKQLEIERLRGKLNELEKNSFDKSKQRRYRIQIDAFKSLVSKQNTKIIILQEKLARFEKSNLSDLMPNSIINSEDNITSHLHLKTYRDKSELQTSITVKDRTRGDILPSTGKEYLFDKLSCLTGEHPQNKSDLFSKEKLKSTIISLEEALRVAQDMLNVERQRRIE